MTDRRTIKVAAIAAASVVASAIALYVMMQPSPRAVVPTPHAAAAPGAPAATAAPAASAPPAGSPGDRPLDRMAERLATRLANEGGSAADWALLGRSYREMGRWPEAVQAFEKSLALAPGDAQVVADLDAARAKGVGLPR